MRAAGVVVAGVTALVAALAAQGPAGGGPAAETPVPVHQEPRHHLVYDSPSLRILDIQIPPGDQTRFHTHDTAILYVPIARSVTRSQEWGGAWSGGGTAPPAARAPAPAPERPGRVTSVTTYVETPYTHRVNNTGESLFRLIGIANRTAGGDAAGSAPAELENRWYRAERLTIAAGASAPLPVHAGPMVVVMQTAGTAAVDGASWHPLNGPGDLARIDGASPHTIHNRGRESIDVVAVAVKGAR